MIESFHDDELDAYDDLGGHDSIPSVASAKAMIEAGMGGEREKKIIKDAELAARDEAYAERYLSGQAESTDEREKGIETLQVEHLGDRALRAAQSGQSTEFLARERARQEIKKRNQ